MATRESVASQALILLRANTISSFSEEGEGEIVNTLYEPHIQGLLSIYPWTFATKKRMFSQDSTAPINEYTYSHILPAETLLLWALFDSNQVGATPVNDYDIYGTDTARRIFSNYSTLYGDYVFRADESVWPPYFEQFAVYSLASVLAVPVTGNADLSSMYETMAYGSGNSNRKGGLFGVATSMESKQKRNEFIVSSPLIDARFS
jgi:hypothetical protein